MLHLQDRFLLLPVFFHRLRSICPAHNQNRLQKVENYREETENFAAQMNSNDDNDDDDLLVMMKMMIAEFKARASVAPYLGKCGDLLIREILVTT